MYTFWKIQTTITLLHAVLWSQMIHLVKAHCMKSFMQNQIGQGPTLGEVNRGGG